MKIIGILFKEEIRIVKLRLPPTLNFEARHRALLTFILCHALTRCLELKLTENEDDDLPTGLACTYESRKSTPLAKVVCTNGVTNHGGHDSRLGSRSILVCRSLCAVSGMRGEEFFDKVASPRFFH